MELLKSRVADVGIGIGSVLVPILLDLMTSFQPIIDEAGPALESFFTAIAPMIQAVGEFILTTFIPAMKGLFTIVKDNADVIAVFATVLGGALIGLNGVAIALGVIKAATAAYAAVQAALNAVLALNPLVLVAIAVAALVAGIYFLATRTTFFQDTWEAMTKGVTDAWQSFSRMFEAIVNAIGRFFTHLVSNLTQAWDTATTDIKRVAEWLGNAVSGVWTGISTAFTNILNGMTAGIKNFVNGGISMFEGFINFILGGLNGLIRSLNKIRIDIPATAFTPAFTFGLSLREFDKINIPRLAEGGVVLPQPGGILANIGEGGQAEAVIPLDRFGDIGGRTVNYTVNVNAGMGADGNRIGEQIVNEILRFERSSGRVFARA
jgi:phage-related protein